jgi:hypothetical protein
VDEWQLFPNPSREGDDKQPPLGIVEFVRRK